MIVYVRLYTCKSITKQRSIAATGVLAGSRRVRRFQDCNPHPHPQTPLPMTLQGSPNPCPTLDIAHILCFFSVKYLGTFYPCAVIHWFNCVGDGPDLDTRMWIVCTGYRSRNVRNIAIIHIDTIYRTAHLIPIYAAQNVNSSELRSHRCESK